MTQPTKIMLKLENLSSLKKEKEQMELESSVLSIYFLKSVQYKHREKYNIIKIFLL